MPGGGGQGEMRQRRWGLGGVCGIVAGLVLDVAWEAICSPEYGHIYIQRTHHSIYLSTYLSI